MSVETPAFIDESFMGIINEIKSLSMQRIKRRILLRYCALSDANRNALEDYYKRFEFWGTLEEASNNFDAFNNRASMLYKHHEDLLWLYNRLEDYRSRFVLYACLNNWYNFSFNELKKVKETLFKCYFDLDVMKCGTDEVFVDLGAYIGDTITDYIETYGMRNYKRIYCYEITPATFNALKTMAEILPNLTVRQKGAYDSSGELYISENSDDTANILTNSGTNKVETVALDDDIDEPVTFIKMDIEGSEQKALLGCTNHIRASKPKLAIAVYHGYEDIWKIPRMIDEICPGYNFYLRYHGGDLAPTEITLLAVYAARD